VLDEAFAIIREITARGRFAVIVGGAVRDLQLGRPLTDVDLATDMPLEEISSLFKTYPVGRSEQFDTVVIARGGRTFEISRFRRGGQKRESPEVTAPASGRAGLLREDTAHRDFTINALLMGLDGIVVDLHGGLGDLRNRVVRCVGSPRERFAEDPARILRAVRFAACLDFSIEKQTAAAIARDAPRLETVAGERIGKEILKIASQPGAALAAAVTLMDRFGLLEPLLPEVANLREPPRPIGNHTGGGAWAHTLAALRASTSADPAVNLAVLLHDVGNRAVHGAASSRCRGRPGTGGGGVDAVARRLYLPQRMRTAIDFAVEHLLAAARFDAQRRSRRLALLASEHWPVLRALALCDCAARGDAGAVDRLEAGFGQAAADAATTPDLRGDAPVISGTRVMELTGLEPGPRVGEIQRRVSEWALDNRVEDPARIEAQVVGLAGEARAGSP